MALPSSKTDALSNYAWVDGEDTPEASPHNAVLTSIDGLEDVVGRTADTDGLIYKVNQGAAKAWVVFDGTSGSPITPDANYGASGTITRGTTGIYTVTWDNPFASVNYVVVINASSGVTPCISQDITAQLVGSITFGCLQLNTGVANFGKIEVIAFGV